MDIASYHGLELQNLAASMMTEMPSSRFDYEPDGLPKEGLDPAFCVPADYDRMIGILYEDMMTLADHAVTANRYSERYLSLSRDLETLIRKLGGMLITRAVLERQGETVKCPEGLTIPQLVFTASYNFNKAHAAVQGTQMRNLRFYLAMLQQETRWASLICRLNATEEKIRLIREGKLEVRLVPEEAEAAKQDRGSRKNGEQDENRTVRAARPAALPLEKEMLRAAAGCEVRIAGPAKAGKKAADPEEKAGTQTTAAGNPGGKIPAAAEAGPVPAASGEAGETADPAPAEFPDPAGRAERSVRAIPMYGGGPFRTAAGAPGGEPDDLWDLYPGREAYEFSELYDFEMTG